MKNAIIILVLLFTMVVHAIPEQLEPGNPEQWGEWNEWTPYNYQNKLHEMWQIDDDWEAYYTKEEIYNYINSKTNMGSNDNSGDMSSRSLSSWLTGRSDIFSVYGTFMNYIGLIFATNDRLDYVQAKCELEKTATQDMIQLRAGLIKSFRTQSRIEVGNFTCDYKMKTCYKIEME